MRCTHNSSRKGSDSKESKPVSNTNLITYNTLPYFLKTGADGGFAKELSAGARRQQVKFHTDECKVNTEQT